MSSIRDLVSSLTSTRSTHGLTMLLRTPVTSDPSFAADDHVPFSRDRLDPLSIGLQGNSVLVRLLTCEQEQAAGVLRTRTYQRLLGSLDHLDHLFHSMRCSLIVHYDSYN
jgi:hypothetical protein